jgi:hypothetical protein
MGVILHRISAPEKPKVIKGLVWCENLADRVKRPTPLRRPAVITPNLAAPRRIGLKLTF